MDMILLNSESTYGPGVGFTDTADLLFHKCRKLADQDVFPIFGTPDPRERLTCR